MSAVTVVELPAAGAEAGWRVRLVEDDGSLTIEVDPDTDEVPLGWPDELPCDPPGRTRWRYRMVDGALRTESVVGSDVVDVIDVSHRPCAPLHVVCQAVPLRDGVAVLGRAGDLLEKLAADAGEVVENASARGLFQTVALLALPLLRQAVRDGGYVPDEVPPVLLPALRKRTCAEAAAELCGDRAHRQVVRALARSLVPLSSRWSDIALAVDLTPAVAPLLAPTLDPNGLADVLSVRPGRQWAALPGVVESKRIGALLSSRPRRQAVDWLRSAIGEDGGLATLGDAASAWDFAGRPRIKAELPLGEATGSLLRQAMAQGVEDVELNYPDEIAELHGKVVEGAALMTLVVPARAPELIAWGRTLHNCLGTMAVEVYNSQRWVIGATVDGALRYAIELRPACTDVVMLGDRNRPPDRDDAAAVVEHLRDYRLLDGHLRRRSPSEPPRELRRYGQARADDEPF